MDPSSSFRHPRSRAERPNAARTAPRSRLRVHLRLCVTCGHVGCCDSPKNKHATEALFVERASPSSRSSPPRTAVCSLTTTFWSSLHDRVGPAPRFPLAAWAETRTRSTSGRRASEGRLVRALLTLVHSTFVNGAARPDTSLIPRRRLFGMEFDFEGWSPPRYPASTEMSHDSARADVGRDLYGGLSKTLMISVLPVGFTRTPPRSPSGSLARGREHLSYYPTRAALLARARDVAQPHASPDFRSRFLVKARPRALLWGSFALGAHRFSVLPATPLDFSHRTAEVGGA